MNQKLKLVFFKFCDQGLKHELGFNAIAAERRFALKRVFEMFLDLKAEFAYKSAFKLKKLLKTALRQTCLRLKMLKH